MSGQYMINPLEPKTWDEGGTGDRTDLGKLTAEQYPILSDLYALTEDEYKNYDREKHQLYTPELLQEILLGLHSMCQGAESKFFDVIFGNNKKIAC